MGGTSSCICPPQSDRVVVDAKCGSFYSRGMSKLPHAVEAVTEMRKHIAK